MADKNQQLLFTPAGGINQDDSIVTPAPGSESGRSLFELGDYRYALNARIGSSRYDSFGDVENIKDTVDVTTFYVYKSLVTNPDFTGSLASWLELAGVAPWTYSSNKAIISTGVSGAFTSNIRYQPISLIGNKITISFSYLITTGFNLGIGIYIVFLNGTTVLSSTQVNSIGIVPSQTKSMTLTLPVGCNAVGFQVSGSSTGTSSLELDYFRVNGLAVGAVPDGDEKVVGKLEDTKDQRLYYCVWNSTGQHSIRYYDPLQNAIFELFRWTGLNLSQSSFVKMAKIENWISFTDRVNPPRLININDIGELYLSLGDANFREFHISHHKWAPTMPPITRAYWDGSTDNAKKLKNKVYQWAYRYIYKGKLKSRFSPTSVANNRFTNGSGANGNKITAIELFIPGFIYDEPGSGVQYNYFGHNDVKFLAAVEAIEIAYRDGQNELWRIFKTIENTNGSFPTTIRFTGESNSTPIAVDDFSQLFDTVPFLAGTVEAIDNRFVFGDCLDEHDPADRPVITNIGVVSADPGLSNTTWSIPAPSVFTGMPNSADRIEMASRNAVTNHTFKSRGRYKLALIYQDHRGWVSGGYTTDGWLYDVPEDTGNAISAGERQYGLTFKISPSIRPPEWAVAYQIVRTNCLNISYFMFGIANKMTVLIDDITKALNDINTLPQDVKNRISQHFENSRIVDGYEFSQLVKQESRKRSLQQYLLSNNISDRLRTEIRNTVPAVNVSDGSRIYIDINNWYNSSKSDLPGTKNNPMNNLFYNYREGDRVRFIGAYTGTPNDNQKFVFDELITEFTGKAIICNKPEGVIWLPNSGDENVSKSRDYLIEVYTPVIPVEEDYLYYETGEWYPVGHPMTEQRHYTRTDWSYTNNASVFVTNYGPIQEFEPIPFSLGDCSMIFKTIFKDLLTNSSNSVGINSSSMTNNIDELWGDWDRGNGRPSISYRNFPIANFKGTLARFSGQIIEDSFVNNINRFIDDNQFFYPSEYGRIKDLVNTQNAQVESVGAILLAIGERETWSIYVNRITIEDLSGRTQVGLSDKVLGSFNALLGSHGTFNPESVSKKRGNVWFWDAINGSWIRYGRDGLTPISSYKMRNWFREIGDLLITKYGTDEAPKVISEYDPFNDEVVTLIDHSSLPETFRGYADYKGAFFSEEDKRWKTIHNYTPEMFGKMNNQLIGFKGGSVILYEKGEDSSTFHGVKYDVKIEPVFMSAILIKSWQTLAVVSSHPWSAERIIGEYRGAKTIQMSNIPLKLFEDQEDTYWSAILNDQNTPNTPNPIFEGIKMRSKAIQVLLTLDPAVVQKSLLHYVSVGYIESPKNPVN